MLYTLRELTVARLCRVQNKQSVNGVLKNTAFLSWIGFDVGLLSACFGNWIYFFWWKRTVGPLQTDTVCFARVRVRRLHSV
ncbi:hypothetical protein IscW_ISCW012448 [Ixodes scapularis]|uniref:Uncharacterized protein n=1 Tax=Ixodes scapularis TaxID=6945 RepID=B7QDS7_IXOSC|nr:hypothetical protein IscW_ISCW012448 [Ixodes scapularis]|eukprot:XP_002413691.1 hypothetical protein IscW_ISCW012448 [Ixodes scapularis]